jgi:lysophospholipase L1-like esterase
MTSSEPAPRADGGRRWLFRAAALGVALLGLAAMEGALRLVGFGPQPLFVPAPDLPDHLEANPRLIERYVGGASGVHSHIDPMPFRREKPADGLRIVVQGGSTAAGFPYGSQAGLAGMLAHRLEAAFPEREIEVVTTALAAVNSWTLLDLVEEIIEIEPDAVLVYAGHNEYLGIFGVGSALVSGESRGATRWRMRLRGLALYQVVDGLVSAVARSLAPPAEGRSLFQRAASGARIAWDSPSYWQGADQLEQNLGELLDRYREAGVPVYLGTLVSNLRDQPPFADEEGAPVERLASRAFDRGRDLDRAGRSPEARGAYARARDLDTLRFRAPGPFNDRIRALAERHGARLVEVESAFDASSPGGIPGASLLLEHVHPTAEGYFLLADAYWQALAEDGVLGDVSSAPGRDEARRDMPITVLDRIRVRWWMQELRSGFPFSDPPVAWSRPPPRGPVEQLAARVEDGELAWLHAMDQLMQLQRRAGRLEEAGVVTRIVARTQPHNRAANLVAGIVQAELGHPRLARRYLLRADPDSPRTRQALREVEAALREQTAQPDRDR